MSEKIGKHNGRNRANRKPKQQPAPISPPKGGTAKTRDGKTYRRGEHGNLIRVN